MQREGTDPENVQPEDILCDFCESAAWSEGKPCVEGHQGSIICGGCLEQAYQKIMLLEFDTESPEKECRMCLEIRNESSWTSDTDPSAIICLRCIKQASAVLQKSKHWNWVKPTKD
ncbi:MAG: hypothetical protein VX436_01625 [Planctomycetota bacterium]|nr:hypothetical protein [Planctomycetota bacterium]